MPSDSFAIFIIPFYLFFFLLCALFSANFFLFSYSDLFTTSVSVAAVGPHNPKS